MDLPTWNDLVTERAAIMEHDGGMTEPDARRAAWADTVSRFGPYPAGTAPTSRETAPGGTGVAERPRNAAERNFGRRTA